MESLSGGTDDGDGFVDPCLVLAAEVRQVCLDAVYQAAQLCDLLITRRELVFGPVLQAVAASMRARSTRSCCRYDFNSGR